MNNLSCLSILFEDDDILVITKPSGLSSLPDGYNSNLPSVYSIVKDQIGIYVLIVHRLDKETSGVMLLAKNKKAHRSLNIQFQEKKIKKEYHAIVIGLPTWNNKNIDIPLKVNGDRNHRTVPDITFGKPAHTEISVSHRYKEYTLCKVYPFTGYTHQIRTHLCHAGYPILGDSLYGNKHENEVNSNIINRLALHALIITLAHPISGETCNFTSPYPCDLKFAITEIQKREAQT